MLMERGNKAEGQRLIDMAQRIRKHPELASVPEYGFLLSGAHFKAVGGNPLFSMESKINTSTRHDEADFLSASGRMFGVASYKEIEALDPKSRAAVKKSLGIKYPVYKKALAVLSRYHGVQNPDKNP